MYRHIKRFLPAVLSLLLLCGIAVTAAARSALEEAKQAPPTSDVPVQEKAYDAYTRLMGGLEDMAAGDMPDAAASHGTDGAAGAAPAESQPTASQYPEFYGGSYTNANGQLVLCVPEGESVPEDISELIGDNYVVETVTYSYAYLKGVMDQINSYLFSHLGTDITTNVTMVILRDNYNIIEVHLADDSPERIAEFKANISDSGAIVFQQGYGIIETAAYSVDTGCGLRKAGSGSSASCGYRAMRNGQVGFVTSAHFANYGNTITARWA